MQQVPVGRVDLHAIHPGVDRAARRGAEVVDDRGDLLGGQSTRDRQRFLALGGMSGQLGRDRRQTHRLHTADVRVRHPADVPQLHEHAAAFSVHGVGDLSPALLVTIGVHARVLPYAPLAPRDTAVASLMIRPAEARCA